MYRSSSSDSSHVGSYFCTLLYVYLSSCRRKPNAAENQHMRVPCPSQSFLPSCFPRYPETPVHRVAYANFLSECNCYNADDHAIYTPMVSLQKEVRITSQFAMQKLPPIDRHYHLIPVEAYSVAYIMQPDASPKLVSDRDFDLENAPLQIPLRHAMMKFMMPVP